MPCIVKVKVVGIRGLSTRAHVELTFASFPMQRTGTSGTNLPDPTWNEDFRYEVTDDALLQDHPLCFNLVTNTSPADVLGKLIIDLNPLLAVDSPYSLSG